MKTPRRENENRIKRLVAENAKLLAKQAELEFKILKIRDAALETIELYQQQKGKADLLEEAFDQLVAMVDHLGYDTFVDGEKYEAQMDYPVLGTYTDADCGGVEEGPGTHGVPQSGDGDVQ